MMLARTTRAKCVGGEVIKRVLHAYRVKEHLNYCKGAAFGCACAGDLDRHRVFNALTKKRYKQYANVKFWFM